MNNVDEIRDVTYKPELLTIVEYIAHSNCYRAKPFQSSKFSDDCYYLQQIGGTAPFINAHNNSIHVPAISEYLKDAPQINYIYSPQTAVMALIPTINNYNPVLDYMGFIIGPVSTPIFYNDIEPKIETDVPFNAEDLYAKVNAVNQTTIAMDLRANLREDTLPGDWSVKGEHTHITVDNISASVGTDLANTHYSSVIGEISNESMLIRNKTIWSNEHTFIIDDGILHVNQYIDNPYSAGLDLEDEQEVFYTYNEYFGKSIGGKYLTVDVLTDNKPCHVLQEKISSNGDYRLNTATRLRLSKGAGFDTISCTGNQFKPQVDDTVVIQKALNTSIPKRIATRSEPYAKDYDKSSIIDNHNNTVDIFQGEAFIDFLDDGSIRLEDAWGSYILLSHGNIQMHAANNLFVVSDRDAIYITGGVESHKAVADIQMESVTSDIKIHAKELLQVGGNIFNVVTTNIAMCADSVSVLSPHIQCSTISGEAGAIILGNTLNSDTQSNIDIYVNSNNIIMTAKDSITATAGNSMSQLSSNNCCISTSLMLGGDLVMDEIDLNLTINNTTINAYNTGGDIKVKSGSIYCENTIEAFKSFKTDTMLANVVAAVNSNDGRLSKIRNLNLQSIKTRLSSNEKDIKDRSFNIAVPVDAEELVTTCSEFTFNKESEACVFIVNKTDLKNTGVTVTINKNKQGKELYIYPGQTFWESGGLEIRAIDSENNVNITNEGFINYLFNEHNMLRKD